MADASERLLETYDVDDFLALVQACGLEMPRDVLDQLERRRLIFPATIDGDDVWTRTHLYLVALYFDAVTQIRHPWTSISGGMTVSEVSAHASDVVGFLEQAATSPAKVREGALKLAEQVRELSAANDPFGDFAHILDLESPRTLALLSGVGRLYAELSSIATALGELAQAPAGFGDDMPITDKIDKPDDEQSEAEAESTGAGDAESPKLAETANLAPDSSSSAGSDDEPPASEPEPESDDEGGPGEDQEAEEEEGENIFAVNDKTEVMDEDELAAVADDAGEAPGDGDENEFAREGSSVTSRTRDLRSRLDSLRHEDKKVARQRGKDVAVEDADSDDENDGDDMAERIAELNKLREKYLASQEWEKLTELYEDGISLFTEPAERQQVFMTLAMLYEVKLNEVGKALDRFIDAYTEEGGNETSIAKALEGIRRVGRQKVNQSRMLEWLEDAVSELSDPSRRAELQREYALALHASGEGQRAFYTYTSYLAEAPNAQLSPELLDDLELLGESVDAGELTEFYRDLLDEELSDEMFGEVAMRAARHAADEGKTETAVEFYEELLDMQPDHEVAFHSLAHLYEDTERWLELYQLYEDRVEARGDDAGPALTSELERVEEELLDHADQITYRLEAAFVSGDQEIVDSFAHLYIKHQRYAEGYAFLNKFVEDADDDGARARAYLALATIATRHLHAPEEAALHYEHALELGGPDADVLQNLARVRFDSGDWTDALMAVKALMSEADGELEDGEKIEWLGMGIRAAQKADRDEDRDVFREQLSHLAPEHELLGDGQVE